MVRPEGRPSREAALAWIRGHCPDLEIQDGGPVGHRARLTLNGRRLTVVVEGPESREEVVQRLWEAVRAAQGAPVAGKGQTGEDETIRRIVEARAAGQDASADELERILIAGRLGLAQQPRSLTRRFDPRDLPSTGRPREEAWLNRDRKVY